MEPLVVVVVVDAAQELLLSAEAPPASLLLPQGPDVLVLCSAVPSFPPVLI